MLVEALDCTGADLIAGGLGLVPCQQAVHAELKCMLLDVLSRCCEQKQEQVVLGVANEKIW